jgi:hypothetical protein
MHDGGNVRCWYCAGVDTPDRMVHLGNHPEVHVCLRGAQLVQQWAREIEDEGKRGPVAFARDRMRDLHAEVVRRERYPQAHRRQTALARHVPPTVMKIELLLVPDCPLAAAAADLITTAVADTGVKATITGTIIASEDQALQRGFTGSPTILLNGSDPFAQVDAPVALACRLYSTPDGLRGLPGLRDLRQALNQVAAQHPGAET